jgi:hypothetical protein
MIEASWSRRSTSASVNRATRSASKLAQRAAEGVALAEDGQPGEAGLEALEAELLEEAAVVVDRPPPLGVVVGEELRGRVGP